MQPNKDQIKTIKEKCGFRNREVTKLAIEECRSRAHTLGSARVYSWENCRR